MSLADILKNPYFLKDREELLNYQLFYEIKKVGLEHSVDFELLEPIIDKNGYDLLIKFRNVSKPFQLKCAERNGTASWNINKKFFRPSALTDGKYIVDNFSASFIGLGGGVILIEYFVNEKNDVEIKYFYSDFVYLSFFQRSVRPWTVQTNYVDYISEIFDDKEKKFTLPKSLFIEVSMIQLLHLSRLLPITDSLKNTDLWTFRYPPSNELSGLSNIPVVTKNVDLETASGFLVHAKIEMRDVYDYGMRDYEINGILKI